MSTIECSTLVRDKIDRQLGECPFANINAKATREWLEEVWCVCTNKGLEVEDIEIVSISATFKVTTIGGEVFKVFLAADPVWAYLVKLYSYGVRVPNPIFRLHGLDPTYEAWWCFVEWLEGDCLRGVFTAVSNIETIPEKVWYSLGTLLASIHSVKPNDNENMYFTSIDIGWWNYVIDANDEVWLIDPKKIHVDHFPERWIYFNIFFHKHVTAEQKKAFTDGYMDGTHGERTEKGHDMLLAAKQFSERLHEKLA